MGFIKNLTMICVCVFCVTFVADKLFVMDINKITLPECWSYSSEELLKDILADNYNSKIKSIEDAYEAYDENNDKKYTRSCRADVVLENGKKRKVAYTVAYARSSSGESMMISVRPKNILGL